VGLTDITESGIAATAVNATEPDAVALLPSPLYVAVTV
jgi:hypothetical protein